MSSSPQPGADFGTRYRIEERLGRGGMSTVFRAWDKQLSRRVAIKFPLAELVQDERFRQRFLRESRLAAAIEHKNIIPIYDAGEVEGRLYLAMRYLEGTNLAGLLAEEKVLEADRALSILDQVGRALDAAHARDLVHRDVKPANILLAPRRRPDEPDDVYLADFGLSKLGSSDSGLTTVGRFVGTASYVAPEQVEGGAVDGRTDLYSLGCVLYECLTGALPFSGEGPMAVLWAHVHRPPPRATERRPELPAEIDAVIARAMAKAKEDRYQSCSELVAAARRALLAAPAGGPGRPAPPEPAPTLVTAPQPATPGSGPEPATLVTGPEPPPEQPPVGPAGEPDGESGGRRGALLLAGAGVLAAVILAAVLVVPRLLGGAPAGSGAAGGGGPTTTTVKFAYTGQPQVWTVPAGVSSVSAQVFGAAGSATITIPGGQAGRGGEALATLKVTPGETVVVMVGGQGGHPSGCRFDSVPGAGGFNGGAPGGGPACPGAGGGGASDLRIGGDRLADRVLVAGGGGGAAGIAGADGGAGGDLAGGSGLKGAGQPGAAPGPGGPGGGQAAGSGSGQLGVGSAGVPGTFNGQSGQNGGGGGGGGYFGGDGGAQDAGGGGGSGFGPPGTVFDTGVRDGNGEIDLTYNPPAG